jgi:lipoxygenase
MVAGQNPCVLECLKVFPPVSQLDPAVYGPQKSAITADHLKHRLEGLTVEQAIEQKKLFIVDYHDLFMPHIEAINKTEGRKSYASRTVLYLTNDGALRPVAIELSLPPGHKGAPGSQRVFTPGDEHTSHWLWTLAKAHVCSNDAGYHQLVSHW